MGLFGNSSDKSVQKVINILKKQGATSESYKERKHCGSCVYFVQGNHCNLQNARTIPSELCHGYEGKATTSNYENNGITNAPEYSNVGMEYDNSFDNYDPVLREKEKLASKIEEIEKRYINLGAKIKNELQNNFLPEVCLQFSGYIKSLEVDTVEELLAFGFAEMKRHQAKVLPRLAKRIMNECMGRDFVSSHDIADHLTIDIEGAVSALVATGEITELDAFKVMAKEYSKLGEQVINVCTDCIVNAMDAEIQALTK